MTLFLESPCSECGRFDLHDMKRRGGEHLKPREGSQYAWTHCEGPGGSRTEVTGKKLRYCTAHGAISHFNTVPQCSSSDLDGLPCSWAEAIVVDPEEPDV